MDSPQVNTESVNKYKFPGFVMDLTRHCGKNIHFIYDEQQYEQTDGFTSIIGSND